MAEYKFVGLDAKSLFQAGAAGTGTKKESNKGALDIITKIGQYALGYYMKAAENLKDARTDDGKIFAQVEAYAMDAGLISADITGIKNDLTEANKVINNVRGMLLPNSPQVVAAQEKRNSALEQITKLSLQYKNFKEKHEYQKSVNDGTYMVKMDSGEQQVADWGSGNTAIQMHNTSILLNGQLEKNLFVSEGELYVSYGDEGMYDGSWDDPKTKNIIETRPNAIKLSDMDFATHANPNQAQLANNYVSSISELGRQGEDVQGLNTLVNMKLDLSNEVGSMTGKEKVDYFFSNTSWTDDGKSKSIVDLYIDNFTIDERKVFDTDGDPGLSEDERVAAKEMIKYNILNETKQDPWKGTSRIVDLIHDKAEEEYKKSYELFEENRQKLIDENKQPQQWQVKRRETRKERIALLGDIQSGKAVSYGVGLKNAATQMVWLEAGEGLGGFEASADGWYKQHLYKGSWTWGDEWGNEETATGSKKLVPDFFDNESLANTFAMANGWPRDWKKTYKF